MVRGARCAVRGARCAVRGARCASARVRECAVDEGMNITIRHPERRGWPGGKRRACPERSDGISSCKDRPGPTDPGNGREEQRILIGVRRE